MAPESVRIEESIDEGLIQISARHPLLAVIALVPGIPLVLGLGALVPHKLGLGEALDAVGLAVVTGLVVYAVAAVGLRRRTHALRFEPEGLEANGVLYPYCMIEEASLSGTAIPAYDTVSAPLPRNTAFGRTSVCGSAASMSQSPSACPSARRARRSRPSMRSLRGSPPIGMRDGHVPAVESLLV
ncbi:MAG: hypothetical protein AAGC57_20195 [Pseudomonadota bacterium]